MIDGADLKGCTDTELPGKLNPIEVDHEGESHRLFAFEGQFVEENKNGQN